MNTELLGNTHVPHYPDSPISVERGELMSMATRTSDRLKEVKAGLVLDEKDTYPMNVLEIMQISQLLDRIVENSKR